ncbi:MAG: tetratricopeptide repeat protein [Blastocatellia bacterium]|nr:tetratricopeptide repeat protein [Blastocatellia bacterium]
MTFNKAKALRQAEKHVQQGKVNAAIDDYTKIAEFDSSDLTVVNTLGDLLVRAGRVEEAIINFTKIAESYRENGFTLKAIAMFKKISKLNPQNVEISLKLAALYSQQGLLVEARQQYLQVADSYARSGKTQKALEVYQKIADLDPENTSVRIKLAETYLRENMREQAHDAYVAAGTELIRKGKVDIGLDACLQALAINPESKAALSAVSDAYISRGEPMRAIDLLKTAFDKNPGDVELIEVLGRTYLAADMMGEAESAFTTLVQLDKSRYQNVLDVGRKYAQHGQLDRAAEQLDRCVDVLISRREEDRAIDFLHTLLDKNHNHIPSLQRLADIYQRIREDHNLIATLEALVEAAVRSGQTVEAIDALKQLVRLEPDNPTHRQRLQSLGVNTEEISTTPTGPFAQRHAPSVSVDDDPSIQRDISDAERMARGGDITSAIMILEQIVDRAPESIEAREHLRQLYTAQRMEDRAAVQCLELGQLYTRIGEYGKAREMEELAEVLNPARSPYSSDASVASKSSFELDAGGFDVAAEQPAGSAGFDMSGGFSIGADEDGFGAFEISGASGGGESSWAPAPPPVPAGSGSLVTDAVLRDELEGVDFYIAQGYLEIARDTLDRLATTYPDHPEIMRRYTKLRSTADLKAQMDRIGTGEVAAELSAQVEQPVESEFDLSSMFTIDAGEAAADENEALRSRPSPFSTSELPPIESVRAPESSPTGGEFSAITLGDSGQSVFDISTESVGFDIAFEAEPAAPEMVEAAPIDAADLLAPSLGDPFEVVAHVDAGAGAFTIEPEVEAEPEGDLLDDLLDNLDDKFLAIESRRGAVASGGIGGSAEPVELADAVEAEEEDSVLQDIFEEFKSTFETDTLQDFDTHYNLGIAYRDMELHDDAIEEFQSAIRATSQNAPDGRYVQCCNMLGLCFMAKDMPRLAVMWFRKGLETPNRPEDEYQAMRFDLGLAYERQGDLEAAIDVFSEVYAIDINYREVSDKLRELQSTRKSS